jgi:hypothetical protein
MCPTWMGRMAAVDGEIDGGPCRRKGNTNLSLAIVRYDTPATVSGLAVRKTRYGFRLLPLRTSKLKNSSIRQYRKATSSLFIELVVPVMNKAVSAQIAEGIDYKLSYFFAILL